MNADEKNDLLVNAHDDQGSTLYGYSAKGEALWNAPLGARANAPRTFFCGGELAF